MLIRALFGVAVAIALVSSATANGVLQGVYGDPYSPVDENYLLDDENRIRLKNIDANLEEISNTVYQKINVYPFSSLLLFPPHLNC